MSNSGQPADPFSTFRLNGKTALVTGAGKGIGRAVSQALAGAGAKVIAVARTAADLDSLSAQFPGAIDVWIEDASSDAFYERMAALPALDILVNNLGTNTPQAFTDVDRDVLEQMLMLNVKAPFLTAQIAARIMQKAGSGSIIHMSSQMGHIGAANRTSYCTTKHAIEGLTKAMAVELAPIGIRVNAVAPTFIETPLTRPMLADAEFHADVMRRIPLQKIGQPEDVAAAVLYLASDASRMVTGDSLKVDGGWTAQ
ncbi:MAG: SDR family oxidoreductase [Pseudomonadota bacterium]